jgi:hypothetical protein
MDAKERLVLHLIERAVAYYYKLLAVDPEGPDETKGALKPVKGSFPAKDAGLSLDELATRVYLFERYGLERGLDFGFWPEDEFYCTWTFAYDPHLPGVREALEIEEWLEVLEWAKRMAYEALVRSRISELSEERAFNVLKRAVQLSKAQRGEVRCPSCDALLPDPTGAIRLDGTIEMTQVCCWCKFVVKREFRLFE